MADVFQDLATGTCVGMLQSLKGVMETGAAFAEARGQTRDELAEARLAPDMFPFAMQIHLACNQARDIVLLLKGEPAPSDGPFGPSTWPDLVGRVDETLSMLTALAPGELAAAEARPIVFPVGDDANEFAFTGLSYVRDWALPNFAFHVVTAYGILRAAGAPIGKIAYLGQVASSIRPRET